MGGFLVKGNSDAPGGASELRAVSHQGMRNVLLWLGSEGCIEVKCSTLRGLITPTAEPQIPLSEVCSA